MNIFKNPTRIIIVLLTLTAWTAFAGRPTNMVDSINIQLTVLSQGGTNGTTVATSTAIMSTKTIIAAVGGQIGVKFSSAAQLLAVRTITYYTNVVYTTNRGAVTSKNVLFAYVGTDRDVIKDGRFVTNVDWFLNGSSAGPAIERHINSMEGQYLVADLTLSLSIPINVRGSVVRTLDWVSNSRFGNVPIYSETWNSLVGAMGNSIVQGSMLQKFLAYDIDY